MMHSCRDLQLRVVRRETLIRNDTQNLRRIRTIIAAGLAAATLTGCACGDYQDGDPWSAIVAYNGEPVASHGGQAWHESVPAAVAASVDTAQPPDCKVKSIAKPPPGQAGAAADPNLLEVARLELERDCYKRAEEAARRRLEAAPNR